MGFFFVVVFFGSDTGIIINKLDINIETKTDHDSETLRCMYMYCMCEEVDAGWSACDGVSTCSENMYA